MTEEVKDFKSGMEEYQAYLNRVEVTEVKETLAEDVLVKYAKIVRAVLLVLAVGFLIACTCIMHNAFVTGLVSAGIIVIFAFLFWARIQVIVNISLTLKKINSKMK